MTRARAQGHDDADRRRVDGRISAAVRHFGGAVGETGEMHRVSDRAERRARAQRRMGT